jgi:methylenetetrahydromethanopterin dehydrogenase
MPEKIRLGFAKLGAIGVSPLIEFTLDERAEREDMEVRVVGSGAKLGKQEGKDVATRLLEFNPHLAIIVSANAKLPGPTAARNILAEGGVPVVVVSDGPTKKIAEDLKKDGFGYIILESDAMIGARREFLDPVEMVWYNAVIAKVLAGTGVFNLIVRELDRVIEQLKTNEKPVLPQIIVDRNSACEAAAYENPYAYSKAVAA